MMMIISLEIYTILIRSGPLFVEPRSFYGTPKQVDRCAFRLDKGSSSCLSVHVPLCRPTYRMRLLNYQRVGFEGFFFRELI